MENPLAGDEEGETEHHIQFKSYELLAKPKISLIVIGYTKKERTKELKQIIALKRSLFLITILYFLLFDEAIVS